PGSAIACLPRTARRRRGSRFCQSAASVRCGWPWDALSDDASSLDRRPARLRLRAGSAEPACASGRSHDAGRAGRDGRPPAAEAVQLPRRRRRRRRGSRGRGLRLSVSRAASLLGLFMVVAAPARASAQEELPSGAILGQPEPFRIDSIALRTTYYDQNGRGFQSQAGPPAGPGSEALTVWQPQLEVVAHQGERTTHRLWI